MNSTGRCTSTISTEDLVFTIKRDIGSAKMLQRPTSNRQQGPDIMTTTRFTQINYTLATLLDQIKLGQIGLPEIQRPFVWPNSKVRDLFDSMYHGYPVGYLLFWSNGLPGGHRQIGADDKQVVPQMLIVDGQQRLTSLYAVVKSVEVVRENYRQERVRIAFRPRDGKFEVPDATVQNDPEFVPDISVLWSPAIGIFQFVTEFVARLKAVHLLSQVEENGITQALSDLHNLVNYPFTALVLSSSMAEEQVAEVFVARAVSRGYRTLSACGGRTERDAPDHGGDRRADRGARRLADKVGSDLVFWGR
jgi:hypothetical protein